MSDELLAEDVELADLLNGFTTSPAERGAVFTAEKWRAFWYTVFPERFSAEAAQSVPGCGM